ncbi:unnamed protein product [Ambrosiozyma monospora]|uniref:Unnamed protein product n=1 Tax=Ambrosiozyma monospora TaxID=43982 RepID=A0ACB5T362_AMBMO|nr:unnamed protein product [Ambrosiozyma monospora]
MESLFFCSACSGSITSSKDVGSLLLLFIFNRISVECRLINLITSLGDVDSLRAVWACACCCAAESESSSSSGMDEEDGSGTESGTGIGIGVEVEVEVEGEVKLEVDEELSDESVLVDCSGRVWGVEDWWLSSFVVIMG